MPLAHSTLRDAHDRDLLSKIDRTSRVGLIGRMSSDGGRVLYGVQECDRRRIPSVDETPASHLPTYPDIIILFILDLTAQMNVAYVSHASRCFSEINNPQWSLAWVPRYRRFKLMRCHAFVNAF